MTIPFVPINLYKIILIKMYYENFIPVLSKSIENAE